MDYKQMLLSSGTIVEGHFVYNSGRHGGVYVNKTAAFVPSRDAVAYAKGIVDHFNPQDIDTVVGPELGAITLMARVTDQLQSTIFMRQLNGVMATKIRGTTPAEFEIGRDQKRFVEGTRVLVVEDILTTGLSASATVRAVRDAGGHVAAVAALWNRGGVTAQMLGVSKLVCLVDEPVVDYPPDDCPLCKSGVPINTNLGKGKEFLTQQNRSGP